MPNLAPVLLIDDLRTFKTTNVPFAVARTSADVQGGTVL